jgi:proteasome lid subunit RPN8/RPN11
MTSNTRSKITLGLPKPSTSTTVTSPVTDAIAEPFPFNRTIRWTPRTAPTASPAVQFVVTQEVLVAVCEHVAGDLSREFGGFLLGNRYVCSQTGIEYVLIDNYYPAGFSEGDAISLLFSTDTWADLTDKLYTRFRGKLLVGWYHSHPRMDIFLSDDDVEVHRSRFAEAWTCALVLEPEKGLGGFFSYNQGRLNRRHHRAVHHHESHTSANASAYASAAALEKHDRRFGADVDDDRWRLFLAGRGRSDERTSPPKNRGWWLPDARGD